MDIVKLGEAVRIVGQTHGVEGATRQQTRIFTRTASLVGTVGISGTLQQHLTGQDGKNGRGVDQGRVAKPSWKISTPV